MSSSHVTASLAQGTLVAGKYRLQRLLGEGAMGVVWSARNEVTSGLVALKLILGPGAELRLRLLGEAQACCQIQHKNVIQIHDVGQMESGDPFLVMELLSGETLADLLARKRRLNQREAAVIGRDVARALSAAHEKGIVHRDLKPANIFLHNQPGEEARVVKVLDFGVSKNLLAADGLQTMMGGAIGSPSYMSPEQARGARDIDARADTWSLGVLLFEMLTGERPFLGEAREVIDCILEGDIPVVSRRVRGIDPGLERLISGCLTRDREQRTWPIADVAARLETFTEGAPRSTTPTLTAVWGVLPAPTPPPSSRPRAPVVVPSRESESESEAETQKLEVQKLATLAAPAVRPVLRAAIPAPALYDPTVRMFSAAGLPAVLQDPRALAGMDAPIPDLPSAHEAMKLPTPPALPPPLPRPPPLPLTPREAAETAPAIDGTPSKQVNFLAGRIFVGGVVAAVVVLLAFTHRGARSGAVAPAATEAVAPAAMEVVAPVSPVINPEPVSPAVEEVQVPAGEVVSQAVSSPVPPAVPPKREVAVLPRPRAANPRPLPRCGRFVKTGCVP